MSITDPRARKPTLFIKHSSYIPSPSYPSGFILIIMHCCCRLRGSSVWINFDSWTISLNQINVLISARTSPVPTRKSIWIDSLDLRLSQRWLWRILRSCVYSICCGNEGTSSKANDADRYVIIRNFLEFIFNVLPLLRIWREVQTLWRGSNVTWRGPYTLYFCRLLPTLGREFEETTRRHIP